MFAPKDETKGSHDNRRGEIEAFIRALNDAWLDGHYDELFNYYAKNCVLLPPSGADPVLGADLIVESYREFGNIAKIQNFDILDMDIFTRSDVAICHLHFEVDYEIENQTYHETGIEIYVMSVTGRHFQVVWRTQKTLD